MGKNVNLKISIFLGILFLIAGTLTLTEYGINWDTINHLPRGQAFLRYFLTGKKDYSDLPLYSNKSFQDPGTLWPQTSGRSLYQSSETDFNYFLAHSSQGHPPTSDILSSLFNLIFYQKLHLINDIDSYRLYSIVLTACLIALIFYWISSKYGKVAGLIASLSIALYPVFWAESHFNNEKDIPETVFWSFFLFCLSKGIENKKIKWIIASGIFFGLALGTKFNILFSGAVILPWITFYLFSKKEKLFSKTNIKIFIFGIIALLLGLGIVFATWPNLWADPIEGLQNAIYFYKTIGLASAPFDNRFILIKTINIYPLYWIIVATSPIILGLFAFGIIYFLKNIRKDHLLLLFFLWLIVPISRVTWAGADIYGGIRQIMEYIPAFAIFAGLGAKLIFSNIKAKSLSLLALLFILSSLFVPIIESFPHTNAYFNFLIGGLSGAKRLDIPFWGNTFGAPYRNAIIWINKNLPHGADLNLTNELVPNIPAIWIRPDINFSALTRSGYLRKGEYSLTLNYQGTDKRSYYDMYLTTFLNPVYQEKVDNVPIVTVWKNDEAHLKNPWIENRLYKFKTTSDRNGLRFDLGAVYKISRLEINYTDKNCTKLQEGIFQISQDGKTWTKLPDVLPESWTISLLGEQPKNGHFIEPFTGESVRYINFNMSPSDTCLLKNTQSIKIYYLN